MITNIFLTIDRLIYFWCYKKVIDYFDMNTFSYRYVKYAEVCIKNFDTDLLSYRPLIS